MVGAQQIALYWGVPKCMVEGMDGGGTLGFGCDAMRCDEISRCERIGMREGSMCHDEIIG